MIQLKTALVCLVVLYGVDAFFFNGWYFAGIAPANVEIGRAALLALSR